MTSYKNEYIEKRATMIRAFNTLGGNFLKWLARNGIDFDDDTSCELRVELGLLAGEFIVIYLEPESGTVAISGYIPFDRVYDEYCTEHGIAWKDFDPQSLSDEEYGKIKSAYDVHVQDLVDAVKGDATMQRVISYFTRSKHVVKIVIDPGEGTPIPIYESTRKEIATTVKCLRFLLGKIESKDAGFKQGLLIDELARSILG